MLVIVLDIVLLVLGVLDILFPMSVGLSADNIYIFFVKAACMNFVYIWVAFFLVLLIAHIVEYVKHQDHVGKKLSYTLIFAFFACLVVSIL